MIVMMDWEREFVRVNRKGEIDLAARPTFRENMAIDFETTGTEVYAKDFTPRLCQVSLDGYFAYDFNVERHSEYIIQLVEEVETLIVHNGSYDLAILDHCFGIPLEETWGKTVDTQEMARLLYPTESEKLNDLARKEFDDAVDSDKELKREFKRLKLTPIGEGYRLIPLDNEIFLKYGGLDAIYTFRLWQLWRDKVNKQLLKAEHALQYRTAAITREGLLCDQDETNRQIDIINAGIEEAESRLAKFGLPSKVDTNEGREIIGEWFDFCGIPIEYSQVSIDNYVKKNGVKPKGDELYHCMKIGADDLRIATVDAPDDVKAIINDLVFIRQAEKIRTAYLEAFLDAAKVDGRVHATIRTMAARTHRMSISLPPLQQIPTHGIEVELSEETWQRLQEKWGSNED